MSKTKRVVYQDFDERIHLIDHFNIPNHWRHFRVIDFGLIHPFVCQWWAADEDERMYRYREIYMSGRTVATHAKQINTLSEGEPIETTVCDHNAEDRLTLEENGIPNIPAQKSVLRGIQKVQERLKLQADERPRLFLLRDSLVEMDQGLLDTKRPVKTEDEFGSYIWQNHASKEQPLKINDDGLDALRYAVMYLDANDTNHTQKTITTSRVVRLNAFLQPQVGELRRPDLR